MSVGDKQAFPGDMFYSGMTLREYYIGQALAGHCANSGGSEESKLLAEWSTADADAIIALLDKERKDG